MTAARILVLVFVLASNVAFAANPIEPRNDEADRRREVQIERIARSAFPLKVLGVHRLTNSDGAELYTVQLDAHEVAGAPVPIITTQIWIVPGATTSMIQLAMRAAAAEVQELVARAGCSRAAHRHVIDALPVRAACRPRPRAAP